MHGGENEECYTALLFPRQIHGPRFCNALQTDGDGILSVSMYGLSTIYHYYSCGFLIVSKSYAVVRGGGLIGQFS